MAGYKGKTFETVVLSVPAPHILLIELNREKALNAFNFKQHAELSEAIELYANDDDLWCGIITGRGRGFCAGQDLKEVNEAGAVKTAPGGIGGITERAGMNKPLIAAVNGLALGGGMELAMATDIIIASEKAVFGLPEVKVGLTALGGGAQNLSKLVGYHNAMYLAMTGMQFPAKKALELGIVQEIVKPEDLMKRAIEVAQLITAASPDGVRATKALAKFGLEHGWLETNIATNTLSEVRAMFRSENMREGTDAFINKRSPKWKGYAKL